MRRSQSNEPAKVWITEKGTIRIRAPYQASFVEYLKQLPKSSRRWITDDKVWEVEYEHLATVLSLLHKFYSDVITINLRGEQKPESSAKSSSAWVRLYSQLTMEDLNSIYRLLVKRHHPDTGGDTQIMAMINACFEELNVR